jgi:predicted Zn-dependent protease
MSHSTLPSKVTLLLFVLITSGCATPHGPAPQFWDAAAVAEYPAETISFMDKPNGKVVSSLHTINVRKLLHTKERIENSAGPMRVQLLVLDQGEPNALSFEQHGQRYIAVNISMINLLGEDTDAMAALIGHELAHLYLDHVNSGREREEDRIRSSVMLSMALGMIGIPAPVDMTDMATTAVTRAYSRDDERDADRFGVTFMTHAGFNAWGAVRLQEKIAAASKGTAVPFMSTHPTGTERIENMKRLAMDYSPANSSH